MLRIPFLQHFAHPELFSVRVIYRHHLLWNGSVAKKAIPKFSTDDAYDVSEFCKCKARRRQDPPANQSPRLSSRRQFHPPPRRQQLFPRASVCLDVFARKCDDADVDNVVFAPARLQSCLVDSSPPARSKIPAPAEKLLPKISSSATTIRFLKPPLRSCASDSFSSVSP